MKIVLILVMTMSIYASDLKERVEKFTTPLENKKIVNVDYDPFQKAQVFVSKKVTKMRRAKTLYVATILN